MYKVTVHEHVIYDVIVEAGSAAEAKELVENSIFEDDRTLWREDRDAGWVDIGDIYDDSDEEVG
jgi:hypothetical protein